MDTTSNGSIATSICASLHTQIGSLFECLPAGERVQIRTPFIFPDGDLIDLYWRDTPQGEVISDLGDTCGWLFVNGVHQRLTSKQDQAYNAACSIYGVERRDGLLLSRVQGGDLADSVVRLAQAITMICQTVDVGRQSAVTNRAITANRIIKVIEGCNWTFSRDVKRVGQRNLVWTVDFVVSTPRSSAVLMALYGRKHLGWQRRAIEHAYTVLSALAPTWMQETVPPNTVSVIDDTDVSWEREPVEILREVSQVVRMSNPDHLPAAIVGET